MPLTKYVTSPQLVAPASAAPISITPSATTWANSAWVQVIASTSTAIVISGIQPMVLGTTGNFEVDIGVGVPGSEVVVTTFKGHIQDTGFAGPTRFPLALPTDNIPTASAVSLRLRKNSTSVTPWTFTLTYWAKPVTGSLLTTAKPQKCAPSAASNIALGSSTGFVNSAWSTIIASVAVDMVLTGIVFPSVAAGLACELDIGVGAAGSEVVITTLKTDNTGFVDAGFCYPLWNPLDVILAGSRVAARNRRSAATGTATVALVYVEKPL